MLDTTTCSRCARPTHASESNDDDVCALCLGAAAIFPDLLSPVAVLAGAPMSWELIEEHESSVIVSVTTRHERDNGVFADRTYLLTADVEVQRESWEIANTWGPDLCADDARELTDDVARAFESRVGVRYRGIKLALEAA